METLQPFLPNDAPHTESPKEPAAGVEGSEIVLKQVIPAPTTAEVLGQEDITDAGAIVDAYATPTSLRDSRPGDIDMLPPPPPLSR